MSEYGDLVAAALHADAEAARAQMRALGICCPSCGLNMADLPDGHALALHDGPGETAIGAECSLGSPALLVGSFDLLKAAASIAVYDDFRRREAEAFKRIIGEGPANFTGLLDVLTGEAAGS